MFRRPKKSATSPARDALLAADRQTAACGTRVEKLDAEIAQLRELIAGEAAADDALQHSVATGGVDSIARFAAGAVDAATACLDMADRTIRAASMARRALPALERDRAAAAAEIALLEIGRREALVAVLIEVAEPIAAKYATTFRQLCDLHDQLAGCAMALAELGRDDIAMAGAAPIEAPRFAIAPMTGGAEYRAFLKYENATGTNRAASQWRDVAGRLAADPRTSIELHKGDGK
jgi:hypothetical protein